MAENNVYRIVLENDTNKSVKKTSASNQSNDGKTEKATNSMGGLEKYFTPMATLGYAKSVADRVITSKINTVSLRTGYEEYQQKLQLSYGIAKRAVNIGESIIMGAKIGKAPGAIAGALIGIGNEVVNIAIRQNELNIARQQEATQIFLNQIRMGAGQRREGRTQ